MERIKRIISYLWNILRYAGVMCLIIIFSVVLVEGMSEFMNCKHSRAIESIEIIDTLSVDMRDSVLNYIYEVRIQHPIIVVSQAVLESGNFSSKLYKENNNPFGMRLARSRPTTAIGVRNGYAVYKNWKDAIIDYGFWQSSYARNLTEDEYYIKLRTYAEDENYEQKLKGIIK